METTPPNQPKKATNEPPKLLSSPKIGEEKKFGTGNATWAFAFMIILLIAVGSYFRAPSNSETAWKSLANSISGIFGPGADKATTTPKDAVPTSDKALLNPPSAISTKTPVAKSVTPSTSREAGQRTEKLYRIGEVMPPRSSVTVESKDGTADLAVKIIKVGKIDSINNSFIETKTLRNTDRIAVVFQIKNTGLGYIENWTYSVKLPTNSAYTFVSENQQKLIPGDFIEYTLGFDGIAGQNGNQITITVDQNNQVKESSETNNTASVKIDGVNF